MSLERRRSDRRGVAPFATPPPHPLPNTPIGVYTPAGVFIMRRHVTDVRHCCSASLWPGEKQLEVWLYAGSRGVMVGRGWMEGEESTTEGSHFATRLIGRRRVLNVSVVSQSFQATPTAD